MKIKLKKALPQPSIGRILPAGVVLDAPEGLCVRLTGMGYAEYLEPKKDAQRPVPKAGRSRRGVKRK